MAPRKGAMTGAAPTSLAAAAPVLPAAISGSRPPVPAGVRESFLPWRGAAAPGERLVYRPALLGTAKLHFVDAKAQVDTWSDAWLLLPLADGEAAWDGAEDLVSAQPDLEASPDAKGAFDSLPAAASQPKSYAAWAKGLADTLYRTRTLDLFSAPSLKLIAKPGESEGDSRNRHIGRYRLA